MEDQEAANQIIDEREKIKPCLVCFAPNDESAEVCIECGSPFGTSSVLTPYQVIGPTGPRWRRAPSGRAGIEKTTLSELIFWGTFKLFITAVALCMSFFTAYSHAGLLDFILFWLGIISAFIMIRSVIRIARNYLLTNRLRTTENDENTDDAEPLI